MTNETVPASYSVQRNGAAKIGAAAGTAMLNLVPVGNDGLDNNQYTGVPLEKVKKMIADYRNKNASGQATQGNQEENAQETTSCWLCLDAVLRLFELDEDLEKVLRHIVKKSEVSGIRIYKGRSGDQDNFVLTTTTKEKQKDEKGNYVTIQRDRLETGNRVLYVDNSHKDEYGGSLCKPMCGGNELAK